jgi:chlorobactene glucosyltransferase
VLANLESNHADLLSVWPEVVTRDWSERVMLPASIFFLCVGVAAVTAKGGPAGKRVDGANGQYIMIKREAYDAIGGHTAIKTDIMEDSAIGRKAIRQGLEVVNVNGEGFLKVKPYSSFGEVWEAHERFGAGLVPSRGVLLGSCALTILYFILPFALLGAALATTNGVITVAAGSMCALVYATFAFFSRKASKLQYFLLAPLSGLLVTAAFATGFVRFRRGGIRWKGIRYASDRFKPL